MVANDFFTCGNTFFVHWLLSISEKCIFFKSFEHYPIQIQLDKSFSTKTKGNKKIFAGNKNATLFRTIKLHNYLYFVFFSIFAFRLKQFFII